MIKIVYSPPSDLSLKGDVEELQEILLKILDVVEHRRREVVIEANPAVDPAPYTFALSKMVVAGGFGPTRISVLNEQEVRVEGSCEALEKFASFFSFDSGAVKGSHYHYEYYEGNEWIAPDSIPLVVGVA